MTGQSEAFLSAGRQLGRVLLLDGCAQIGVCPLMHFDGVLLLPPLQAFSEYDKNDNGKLDMSEIGNLW